MKIVNYINAHATSTIVGDLAEVTAIKKVFKNTSEIKINSTKVKESMIGHCLGAAGGLEAIATMKAIRTGWLHPTINQFDPEPSVEFDTVPNTKKQHEVNVGMMNDLLISEYCKNAALLKKPDFYNAVDDDNGCTLHDICESVPSVI
ncbi:3-oxoacyl-[acyl-carrier-protein] synthase I, chloroplastic [Asimina triloba]